MKKTLLLSLILLCSVFKLNSQTTFSAKQVINATGDQPYSMATGNIDGDLFDDIIIATYGASHEIQWYKNNGNGTFTPQTLIANSLSGINLVKLGDLNNDTFNDIVLTAYLNDKVVWFAGDGSGGFSSEMQISNSVSGASGLAIADIDGNTTPDIIVTANNSNEIVWFSNNGTGTFTPEGIIDNTITAPGTIEFKDIDGDTDLDAVVTDTNYNLCQINILRSSFAQNSMVTYTKDPTPVATNKYYLFNATFEDIDGDSNLDILASDSAYNNFTGGAYWYEYNGSGFTENQFTTSFKNPSIMHFRDLDNDGLKDIVLSNGQNEGLYPGSGDIAWFKNTGIGNDENRFMTEDIIDTSQSNTFYHVVNDFDNDGDLDIASCSYNQDTLNWFENYLINPPLGLPDNKTINISIYPNPTKNELNFKGFSENFEISVYDILGKNILNKTLETNASLDVSKLERGIYILKFNNYNATFKFVKE